MRTTRSSGRVAVIVPVCRAAWLAATLDSVLLQSRPPDEVIVIGDGCANGEQVRRAIAPYADRVVCLHSDGHGAARTRDAGIVSTNAEFIAVVASGDRWLPHFLRMQLQVLEQPDVHLSFTNALVVGESPDAGLSVAPPLHGTLSLPALLAHGRLVPCSVAVGRRTAMVDAGGFDPSIEQGLDFDLWTRMADGGRICALSKVLVLRRAFAMDAYERLDELAVAARAVERLLGRERPADIRAAIEACLRALRSEMDTTRGRTLMEQGDLRAARAAFSAACTGPHGWRVRATHLALALAPWLVRRVYTGRLAPTSE